ncbi:Aste57867_2849 [Aphanomyces stellatus]|uniref:Aste57867_2849 protein n=1 Tax=Aphanomyces stellatus TaxID=120398 RepID=A0A485K8F7_9STRA|nr:hypothetical protein As57867_002841 [Aphanomyces stellatus]VFT80036.1 Aste57867_2849 [Aphanomyces stellatus]
MSNKPLALYRRILRVARSWTGPEKERVYIKEEARREFDAKRGLKAADEIENALTQGEQRMEVGVHYKNPYPRPVYVDPGTMGGEDEFKRRSKRDKTKAGKFEKQTRASAFKWK